MNNKSRDIFYGVVAIATLIVALLGATLAYFSMSTSSSEGAVSAKAAVVSVNYEDGQQVIAQASNLIPVDFDIMQTLYRRNLDAINLQAEDGDTPIADKDNLCKDGHNDNYEVCSVYRFSVSNDTSMNITAMLRTELNEFTDLYYAVRDGSCTATAENEDQCWKTLKSVDEVNYKYVKLETCGGESENACYTGESTKTYEAIAQKPIFGYDPLDSGNFKSEIVAATEKSYDVVLFILNDSTKAQNYDQGKAYSGNLYVETDSITTIQGALN